MKIVKTVVHYEDGSTVVCRPQEQPPEVPPATDRWTFDHLVTADDPNRDIVIPGPVTTLEIDLRFTAGPEKATSGRIQILGVAGTEPGKPWIHNDLGMIVILNDQRTWRLRHGIGVDQTDKDTDQAIWPILPGQDVHVRAGFDLGLGEVWAKLIGRRQLQIQTAPQHPYTGDMIVRFGEPGVHGGEGPWWGARYVGEIWRPT